MIVLSWHTLILTGKMLEIADTQNLNELVRQLA